MNKKFCIYQEVTDRIIEKLENGNIPWVNYLKQNTKVEINQEYLK